MSVNRACQLICLARSMYYYQSKKNDDEIISALLDLVKVEQSRGFDYCYNRLRNEGKPWNIKRVLRVYRSLNLTMRRKIKKRLPNRFREKLYVPTYLNHTWSIDFMSDSLHNGRRFRVLNVIDDFNRECIVNRCFYSVPSSKLIEVLEEMFEFRAKPKRIRVDNGPEFIAGIFKDFCDRHKIELKYIQPGKPAQNAYIERFNRTFREDILDAYIFETIREANQLSQDWQLRYNNYHPHKSLNYKSPLNYIKMSLPDGQVNL